MRFRLVALAVLVLAGPPRLLAQSLPHLALDSLPEDSRRAIGVAYQDAVGHPNDAARVGRLAMTLHAWEQFDTAAQVYARARQLEQRFDWYYLGGQVESRLAHHEAAGRLFIEAVRLAPGSLPARVAVADALFEAGDAEGAAREYTKLTTGLTAPQAHYGLGRYLEARGEHQEALTHLQTAVTLFPEFGAAWYTLGMAQRNLGRIDEAKQSLAKAQEYGARWPSVDDPLMARVRALRDDAAAHVDRGLALQRQGDVKGALGEYETALKMNPHLAVAHVNSNALFGQQKDWVNAEAHYNSLVQTGPVPAEAHFNYAMCLAAQGKNADAESTFRKAVETNPQYAGAWSALGRLAELNGRVQEAETDYRKAGEFAPNDPLVRLNIARMLIARQQYREAIAQLEPIANADHPERARVLFGLSTAYVLAGDVASGRQYAVEARDVAKDRGQNELAAAIERDLEKLPK